MRIDRLRLRSTDPAALLDFYARALDAKPQGDGFSLGEERIALAPGERDAQVFASNETGFQHFAIVVDDIAAAYAHLQSVAGWRPISLAGPEQLPQSSGGASAFKFRDPEGRPLELLQFAPNAVPALWRARFGAGGRFHGVDHTGLSVRDAEASRVFFEGLGFVCTNAHINVGREQASLDGFAERAEASVAIVSLSPPDGARPGVELLGYREPAPQTRAAREGVEIVIADPVDARRPTCDLDGHRLVYLE